ncbi:MAG: hypothetical protein NVSMB6_01750 [Burkholderiaceae bacterium]
MEVTRKERADWFDRTGVSEVWGCGHRITAQLCAMGIDTVQALCRAAPNFIRTHFGVVMERTVQELQGESCLDIEEVARAEKEICCSRSFGTMATTIDEMTESVTKHVTHAAEKLRRQRSTCSVMQTFIQTNRFRTDDPQYNAAVSIPLIELSNDTRILTTAAFIALHHIYKPGFQYKKSGIMLIGLQDQSVRQLPLFDTVDPENRLQVMGALDLVNQRFGRLASQSVAAGSWITRADSKGPAYTTRWVNVPLVW